MKPCIYCNLSVEKKLIATHTRWCKNNPKVLEYKNKKQATVLKCPKCHLEFCLLNQYSRRTTCSIDCEKLVSDKTKKLISEKRKTYLSENPDKHVWKRNDKFSSVPCEKLKSYLVSNNIEFIEEHQPLDDRYYSIDIAFPNIKIGVEVNGNQHYNPDGTLTKYYQDRHDAICASGWKLIEVHYSLCFNEQNYSSIFNFDIPLDSNKQIEIIKKSKEQHENPKTLPKGQTTKIKTDKNGKQRKTLSFNIILILRSLDG